MLFKPCVLKELCTMNVTCLANAHLTLTSMLLSLGSPALPPGTPEITAELNVLSNEDLGTCLLRPNAFQKLAGQVAGKLQVLQCASHCTRQIQTFVLLKYSCLFTRNCRLLYA